MVPPLIELQRRSPTVDPDFRPCQSVTRRDDKSSTVVNSASMATHTFEKPPTMDELQRLDEEDKLKWTRDEFEIPNAKACGGEVDGEAIYFCGNSLGLLSKKARQHVLEELDVWSTRSVTADRKRRI